MPEYLKDIRYIVQPSDVDAMLARAPAARERALTSAMYLTGARPIEIISLTAGHIKPPVDGWFSIQVPTAKLGKSGSFKVQDRILEFPETAPYAKELLDYAAAFPPEARLFPFNPDRLRQIIYKLSENQLCPYNFRHSRLTKLARSGASVDELMYFKGASSSDSVDSYISAKPIGRRLEIT